MSRSRVLIAVAIFWALGGCVMPQSQSQQGFRSADEYQTLRDTRPWPLDDLALAPLAKDARAERPAETGAPAVVLLDERTVTHRVFPASPNTPPHTVVEVRRAMRLDHRSAVAGAQVRIHLDADAELLGVEGETLTADGRAVPLGEIRSFDLARYFGVTPDRSVVFAFPYAEPGAIVRWAYRIKSPGLRPLDVYQAPPGLPVRNALYRLRTYSFVEISSQRHGMTPSRSGESEEQRTWTWQASDLPFEPGSIGEAPRPSGRASVRVAVRWVLGNRFVRDWPSVLEPMLNQQLGRVQALPRAWPDAPPGPDPMASAVAYVQRDLAPGHTPLASRYDSAEALHRFRRATANERAGLVFALLTQWEVGCGLLLSNPRGAMPIAADFPMPVDGSRLLVECGDRIYDPGCAGCALGRIRPSLGGRFAIAFGLDDDDRLALEFRRLPEVEAPPVERRYTLAITDRGLVADRGEVVLRGADADRVRHWLRLHPLPPEDAARAAGEAFLDGIDASRIEISGHDVPTGPVRFDAENVLVSRGDFTHGPQWSIVPFDVIFGEPALELVADPTRTRPVALRSEMGFVNRLALPPPDGWTVTRSPAPTVIESPFGTYRLERPDGEGLALSERLDVIPAEVQPGDWPALRDFLARIVAHRQTPIVLRRTP